MDKINQENGVSLIEKAIIRVIAFFDLFDYPLTAREVWSYIDIKGLSLNEVWDFLDSGMRNIDCQDGFYFFSGRAEIVQTRKERFGYACQKIEKTMKVVRIFSFFPWIKMIAIGNIIGSYNLKEGSDIDLFIITKKNRIWVSRFFCVVTAMLFRWRPQPGKEKDKICLSFFISEDAYDLELFGYAKEDIYLTFWLVGLFPVYNIDHTYEKFIRANEWLREKLPNWKLKIRTSGYYKEKPFRVGRILNFIFGPLEKKLKKFQLKVMPNQLKEIMNQDTRVIVSDQVIKLHSKDRRQIYQEKFRANYQARLSLLN